MEAKDGRSMPSILLVNLPEKIRIQTLDSEWIVVSCFLFIYIIKINEWRFRIVSFKGMISVERKRI